MGRRRSLWSRCAASALAPVLATCVTLAMVAGCTGEPSSTSAWQSSSDRAIGELISGLGTARVVLEEESQGDLQHSYAVVTVTDAIETSSRELSSYLVGQPPDGLHRANDEVARSLHEAMRLLVEVRVELASPGVTRSSAQDLTDRIDAMRKQLDQLESNVTTAPGSVGSP
jgi:hypothetical protein